MPQRAEPLLRACVNARSRGWRRVWNTPARLALARSLRDRAASANRPRTLALLRAAGPRAFTEKVKVSRAGYGIYVPDRANACIAAFAARLLRAVVVLEDPKSADECG